MPLHVYKSRKRPSPIETQATIQITSLTSEQQQEEDQVTRFKQQQQQQQQLAKTGKMLSLTSNISRVCKSRERRRRGQFVLINKNPLNYLLYANSLIVLIVVATTNFRLAFADERWLHQRLPHKHHHRILDNQILPIDVETNQQDEQSFSSETNNKIVLHNQISENKINLDDDDDDDDDGSDDEIQFNQEEYVDSDQPSDVISSDDTQKNNHDHDKGVVIELNLEDEVDLSTLSNQPVPEHLPIVVSSSDNSYVSASPIIANETTTTSKSPTNHKHQHHKFHMSSSPHNTRFRYNYQNSTLTDSFINRHHTAPSVMSRQHNPILAKLSENIPAQKIFAHFSNNYKQFPNDESRKGSNNQNDRQRSNSDISTTATTTERNKDFIQSRSEMQQPPNSFTGTSQDRKRSKSFKSYPGSHEPLSNEKEDENNLFGENSEVKSQMSKNYRIRASTIIKTRESIQSGATFINYTIVTNFNACLIECWITETCDTAIYQESPVDFNTHLPYDSHELQEDYESLTSLQSSVKFTKGQNNDDDDDDEDNDQNNQDQDDVSKHNESNNIDSKRKKRGYYICYLFECVKTGGFKCQFSNHNYYVSAIDHKSIVVDEMGQKGGELIPRGFIRTLRPETKVVNSDESVNLDSIDNVKFTIEDQPNQMVRGFLHPNRAAEPKYSNIVHRGSHQVIPSFNGARRYQDAHIASIQIGGEEYKDYPTGGLNSAIIAILIGIAATGMLILVVGHKMNSIKRKIAYKGRRRSIVPDKDFLINTLPS